MKYFQKVTIFRVRRNRVGIHVRISLLLGFRSTRKPIGNQKVEVVFYRRHPELKGTKLTSMNGSLAREWMSLQDSLC